jgi:hypothetical protein
VEKAPKAARAVSINGVTVFPSYSLKSWRGETYGLMAISNLVAALPPGPPLAGLHLCMALDMLSACGAPEALCYGDSCVFSLFNEGFSCCPASQVPF